MRGRGQQCGGTRTLDNLAVECILSENLGTQTGLRLRQALEDFCLRHRLSHQRKISHGGKPPGRVGTASRRGAAAVSARPCSFAVLAGVMLHDAAEVLASALEPRLKLAPLLPPPLALSRVRIKLTLPLVPFARQCFCKRFPLPLQPSRLLLLPQPVCE